MAESDETIWPTVRDVAVSVDELRSCFNDFKEEFAAFESKTTTTFEGIEQHLGDQEEQFAVFDARLKQAEQKIDGIVGMMGTVVDVLADMNSPRDPEKVR